MSAHDDLVLCLCELTTLLWYLLLPLVFVSALLTGLVLLLVAGVRAWLRDKRNARRARDGGRPTVAFFHPYCTAGGGRERALWCALRALQNRHLGVSFVVYSGDVGVSGQQILDGVRRRFDLRLPRPVRFVFLRRRWLLEAPPPLPGPAPLLPGPAPLLLGRSLALLGRSLGSLLLGLEALVELVPDLYVDSAGHALTLPLFRYLGGCGVVSYVHEPAHVHEPRLDSAAHASGLLLSALTAPCHFLFASLCSHAVVVGSARTLEDHALPPWCSPGPTPRLGPAPPRLVPPPCGVSALLDLPLDGERRSIVSVGRFRAEKNHELLLRAFRTLLERREGPGGPGGREEAGLRLVLIGGCGDQEEEDRVLRLRGRSVELGVADRVEFKVNASFEELRRELAEAAVALHATRDEHFSVGVVQCMAAGAVVVATQRDMVAPYEGGRTGFLADGEDGYADAMETALALSPAAILEIRRNARRSVGRFSDREFEAGFLAATETLMGTLAQ